MERETVETLNGRVLPVELTNGKLRIQQSRLLFKDTEARNDVIHYIYPALAAAAYTGHYILIRK